MRKPRKNRLVCKVCKSVYNGHGRSRYCSHECFRRSRLRTGVTKKCRECKSKFKNTYKNRTYCSEACRTSWRKKAMREYQSRPEVRERLRLYAKKRLGPPKSYLMLEALDLMAKRHSPKVPRKDWREGVKEMTTLVHVLESVKNGQAYASQLRRVMYKLRLPMLEFMYGEDKMPERVCPGCNEIEDSLACVGRHREWGNLR